MKNNNIEDKFFGKRIVKAIFDKAQFAESSELKTLRKELKQLENKFFEFPSDTRRMAELKKAIKELRLKEKAGMSRTCVKKKFGKSDYYALEGTVDGMAAGSKTVENIEEAMYYGKAMLEHMKKQSPKAKVATVHIFKVVNYQRENTPVKVLNSRTGGKSKFGKAEQVFKDGTVHLNFSEAKQWLSAASVDELKYIVKDAREAANAMGTEGNKWNYYHDLVLTAQDELAKRKPKMSRAGGKAKFVLREEKTEEQRRYDMPVVRKEKVLEMLKTGKYLALTEIKDGVCSLRNTVNGKRVDIYVD